MTRGASLLSSLALTMNSRALIVIINDVNLDIPHRVMKSDELVLEIVLAPLLQDTGAAKIVIRACSIQAFEPNAPDRLRADITVGRVERLLREQGVS